MVKKINKQNPAESKTAEVKKIPPLPFSTHNHQAHRNMWLGVFAFMLIILGFWGWALKLHISSINWHMSKENGLTEQVKKDWDEIFTEVKSEEQTTYIKKQISNTLDQIINE